MMSERKLFAKNEFIFIGILIILALGVFLFYQFSDRGDVSACVISLEGKPVQTVDLFENQNFSLEQLPNVVFEVKDNAIAFIHSDCPDKVCIRTGYLKRGGQMAACLPNHVSIKIVSQTDASPDDEADVIAR